MIKYLTEKLKQNTLDEDQAIYKVSTGCITSIFAYLRMASEISVRNCWQSMSAVKLLFCNGLRTLEYYHLIGIDNATVIG